MEAFSLWVEFETRKSQANRGSVIFGENTTGKGP